MEAESTRDKILHALGFEVPDAELREAAEATGGEDKVLATSSPIRGGPVHGMSARAEDFADHSARQTALPLVGTGDEVRAGIKDLEGKSK